MPFEIGDRVWLRADASWCKRATVYIKARVRGVRPRNRYVVRFKTFHNGASKHSFLLVSQDKLQTRSPTPQELKMEGQDA